MKRITKFVAAAAAIMLLAGCVDSVFKQGSAANPPTDVKVVAGDSSATVTWTATPSVQYWLFAALADAVTPQNWDQLPGGRTVINVSSPVVVTGLLNGSTYSFTLNGRTDNGPGGAGSPSISVVPRLAGGTWTTGTALANDLRGITYGTVFVSVGANGSIYTSPDFNVWTPVTWTSQATSLAAPVDLNAAVYANSLYIVVGSAGTILTSSDAVTWTTRPTGTTNALYGVAANGLGGFVAVGEKGTILVSVDGVNWTSVNSGVTADLYDTIYGYGAYVAVGAKGTLLATGADTATWVALTSNTSSDLRGIAFGVSTITGSYEYIAVGAAGATLISADGVTWAPQTPITTRNLNSITYNRQFILVGDGGTVITSADGTAMTLQTSGTINNLNAVSHSIYGLAAVGSAGTNLSGL